MNEFNFPVRVYYEDTDAGGVVYWAFQGQIGRKQSYASTTCNPFAVAILHGNINYR